MNKNTCYFYFLKVSEVKEQLLFVAFVMIFMYNIWAYTGEIVAKHKLPFHFPTGLMFDGTNIWIGDRKTDTLYCFNPMNAEIIAKIAAPAYWPAGLAYDGKNIWCVDVKGGIPLAENYNGVIYKLDKATGAILHTVQAPCVMPWGLAYDGKYLWCVDLKSDEIIQFETKDGTTIRSFKAPSGDCRGLCYDGKYLWTCDRLKNEIYMIDPESGCVIIITEAPGPFAMAICNDGNHLWVVDAQEKLLYQLKVNDGVLFRKYKERKLKVTYTHQITNFGPGTVKTADVHFAIGNNRDNQTLLEELKFNIDAQKLVTDKWGQQTKLYRFENIKSGGIQVIEMVAKLKLYEVRYFIYPDKVGKLAEVPLDIRSTFLQDDEKYQLKHPVILQAVKEAVGNESNPYWIARKIYNFLMPRMYYEMTGGWNTSPTVLKRGNGSCSEYTFVYIAMCRAAGLPARYVGSMVVRGDDASYDDVFHRWVEVYLPNYGWIPVDPSGGDKESPRDQADNFGALANRFYITTQGGGGSETLGWQYNSQVHYTTEPKTNIVVEYFADWEPIE